MTCIIFEKNILEKELNEKIKVVFFKKTKKPRSIKDMIQEPICFKRINLGHEEKQKITKLGENGYINGESYVFAEIPKKTFIEIVYHKALQKQKDLLVQKYAQSFDLNIGLNIK